MGSSDWARYRTVIEEPRATESIAELIKKNARFEEQWGGFVWLVARKPAEISVKQHSDSKYNLAHRQGDKSNNLPDLAVVYVFDDDTVTIVDVMVFDVAEDS